LVFQELALKTSNDSLDLKVYIFLSLSWYSYRLVNNWATICRTRIARIGEISRPPRGGMKERKILR
jgi:hypothetical protein